MSAQEPRNVSTLKPPVAGQSYREHPATLVGFGTDNGGAWCRAFMPVSNSGTKRDARYFSPGNGRFDLLDPMGSLNLAKTPETALRERLGRTAVNASYLPSSELDGVFIARIDLPGTFKVADFQRPGPGIAPGDIGGALEDYSVTQQWATQMRADGFEGIIARSRFGESETLYLFGDAGENLKFGTCISDYKAAVDLAKDLPYFPQIIDLDSFPDHFDFE